MLADRDKNESKNSVKSAPSKSTGGKEDSSPGVFREVFGLDASEMAQARSLFIEAMSGFSVDAGEVFDAFATGRSITEPLALPDGVCDALYETAYRWLNVGNCAKAEPLFRVLCTINSEGSPDYWIGYALCLKDRGVWSGASYCLRVAMQLDPGWAVPYFHMLDMLMRQERWDLAREVLNSFETCRVRGDVPQGMLAEAKRWADALELRENG